jgi:hypothetical protein
MLVAWCSFLYGPPNGRWYLPSRASMGPTRRRWTFSRAWPTCCTRRPTAPHLMIVTAQAELSKRRPAPGGRQRAAGTPSATNRCPIRRPHSVAGPPRIPGPDTRGSRSSPQRRRGTRYSPMSVYTWSGRSRAGRRRGLPSRGRSARPLRRKPRPSARPDSAPPRARPRDPRPPLGQPAPPRPIPACPVLAIRVALGARAKVLACVTRPATRGIC